MDEVTNEAIVLGTIKAGIKSFNKISNVGSVPPKELEQVLEKLESAKLIAVNEKKGFFGKKIEINTTEKGEKILENQIQELREKWKQMTELYKLEEKQKLEEYINENKVFFKQMIFFGILNTTIVSSIFNMVGLTMADYISPQDMPHDLESGI